MIEKIDVLQHGEGSHLGSKIIVPEVPTKEGYIFSGWHAMADVPGVRPLVHFLNEKCPMGSDPRYIRTLCSLLSPLSSLVSDG